MNSDMLSSGFVGEDIPADEERFSEIKELYVSTGGYSRLYQCRRHGKWHVMKCLQPLYTVQDMYEQLLEKEFNIGYQLEHPHICRTLGWEKHETLGNCILLEYIDGITLKVFMEQGKLTRLLARKLIVEICSGLQYIHNKQIVHRDLKPANILITHNGNNVKLIDFGLSDCDDYDILKIPAGTRRYLAPEQLVPHTALDSRIDIYSLGVIIQEMATLLGDKQLKMIAQKCTQRDPKERYGSAQEVAEMLNRKQSNRIYRPIVAFLFLVFLTVGFLKYPFTAQEARAPLFALPSEVSHQVSIGNANQRRLLLDRNRIRKQESAYVYDKQLLKQDSLRLFKTWKQLLVREFPTPELRHTAGYQQSLQVLENEIDRIYRGKR